MRTTKVKISLHICTSVVLCLDSILPVVSISKISSFYLASVTVQASLSLPWSQNPEDRFSRDMANFIMPSWILAEMTFKLKNILKALLNLTNKIWSKFDEKFKNTKKYIFESWLYLCSV